MYDAALCGPKSVFDFDPMIDQQIFNELPPGDILVLFGKQYTDFEHMELGHPK